MSKNIKTRIQNKHDLEVNWLLAETFVPLQGELIVYDIEVDSGGNILTKIVDGKVVQLLPADRSEPYLFERFKIGDGIHTVGELPFATEALLNELDIHTADAIAHISATDRASWNAAKVHADSSHAPSNAEKNQNAFSSIAVGSTTIAADTATDTITLVAGSNVTITPDATNDKITIAATNTTYSTGTTTASGLTKLYTSTGSNTDGAMTQAAATSAVNNVISSGTADPSTSTASQFYFKYSTQ